MEHAGQPGLITVPNESENSTTRETRDGRRLIYRMNVIQQPQRARACGSGSKSSADRRPVDPPPIVDLRVFEQKGNTEEDITFTMHANFFIFATLEQARHHAHGRVSQDRSQPTVLTGTPVAGLVLLDRPTPAGYFIFPDLSVRHEGKYRLAFSLYEELKDTKDEDKGSEPTVKNEAGDTHVTHRLEVKSEPFTVYSAKKFPGLTSSTSLSRVVAEQGCRVRIRRDVRMRKRDVKGGKDWDGYEDETEQARARLSTTPMPEYYGYSQNGSMEPVQRPRSASNVSHHTLAPSLSRRQSLQDLNQSYQQSQYGTAPHTPTHGFNQPSPYGPSPAQHFTQPPYMQNQQQSMQPPPPQYQPPNYPQPTQMPAVTQQFGGYGYGSVTAQSPAEHFMQPGQFDAPRQSVDHGLQMMPDYRRATMPQVPPPPPPSNYMPQQSYQNQPASQAYPQPPPPPLQPSTFANQPGAMYSGSYDSYAARPAPMETMQPMQPPNQNPSSATSSSSRPSFGSTMNTLPPLTTSNLLGGRLEASSPLSAGPPGNYQPAPQSATEPSNKRRHDQVFPSVGDFSQPLKAGARPGITYGGFANQTTTPTAYTPTAADDDDDAECDVSSNLPRMQYRRADGKYVVSTWDALAAEQ